MKDMDLMKGLNDLDDDILREAETFEIRKHRGSWLPRVAAVAAAAAMLCVTVYAVVTGVQVGFTGKTDVIPNGAGVDTTYNEAQIGYDLTRQEIPADSMEVLRQHLEEHWLWCSENRSWSCEGESFVTYYYLEQYEEEQEEGWHDPGPGVFTFDSFEEAEEFLGLSLNVPPTARDAELEKGILLRVLTDPIGEAAYVSSGDMPQAVTPGCVELWFHTVDPTYDLWVLNGNIIIPLSDAFAAEQYSHSIFYSSDYEDVTTLEEFTAGTLEGKLVYRAPIEDSEYDDLRNGMADAYYVCDGIGYAIHSCPSDNSESDDPREVLLPYLEEISE